MLQKHATSGGETRGLVSVHPQLQWIGIEAGVKTVILPAENEQDVRYLPDYMRDRVEIEYVREIREVLELALVQE